MTRERHAERIPHPLAWQLRVRRFALGWSQKKTADAARMKQSHLSDIETGFVTPTLTTFQRLADALGYELRLAPKDPS